MTGRGGICGKGAIKGKTQNSRLAGLFASQVGKHNAIAPSGGSFRNWLETQTSATRASLSACSFASLCRSRTASGLGHVTKAAFQAAPFSRAFLALWLVIRSPCFQALASSSTLASGFGAAGAPPFACLPLYLSHLCLWHLWRVD